MMTKFFIFLILFTFIIPAYGVTIYKWVDEKGVVNFTDDYNQIPSDYRDRVEVEIREDTQKPGISVPPQTPLQKSEEGKTDIYGRDETWWREKVRPWKERLKEAERNYDSAHRKFMERAEKLSQRRFWSHNEYRINIIELDRFKEEMIKYQTQIAEIEEMLEKLSKDARESKANPDWLK